MATGSTNDPVPQQIIQAAERLMAQGGLSKASLNSIAADSVVPRGSLLHYFPEGKMQIVRAALKAHDESFTARVEKAIVPGEGFARSLSALMLDSANRMKVVGFDSGCPVAGVVLDLAETDEELRTVCAEIVKGWEAAMAGALTQLDKTQRHATGEFIVAAYEGAILMAKLKKSTAPLLNAARHIALTLRALS